MIGFAQKPTEFELVRKPGHLYEIASDVAGIPLGFSNAYFLGEPGSKRWLLVDAGSLGFGPRIRHLARHRFGLNVPPEAIILTHGHFDHVGGLHDLLQHWNVSVYAHKLELPFLTGRCSYPPPDPSVGGGLLSWISPLLPQKPIALGSHVQALPSDNSIPSLIGWRWVPTPGHSPGHISLFRESDRILIAGDAVVTLRQESLLAVLFKEPQMHGPPAYFTPDWAAARESVERLANLEPQVIAAGHGWPLRGEATLRALQSLAANFQTQSVPIRGRYVGHPAIANHNGIVSVPPPIIHPLLHTLSLGAVALAAAAVGAATYDLVRTQFFSRDR